MGNSLNDAPSNTPSLENNKSVSYTISSSKSKSKSNKPSMAIEQSATATPSVMKLTLGNTSSNYSNKSNKSSRSKRMILKPSKSLSKLLSSRHKQIVCQKPMPPLSRSYSNIVQQQNGKKLQQRNKQNTNNDYQANNKRIVNTKIVQIAADFWNSKVNNLTFKDQLEIGVSIYLSMMVKHRTMKDVFNHNFAEQQQIETISLKFLNMLGWLIRSLLRNDVDIEQLLNNLGSLHHKCGVNITHFNPMLESIHETFSYYFPNKYRLQEKYAIDYIFKIATKMMMGGTLSSQNENNDYLKSLQICLKSPHGRQYLYKYLQQTWCDELAIYLQSVMNFNNQTSDKGRFIIARDIVETSINPSSNLSINISYECRQCTLSEMDQYEKKFLDKDGFVFADNFFKRVDREIFKLILDNHWDKFVKDIKNMNK